MNSVADTHAAVLTEASALVYASGLIPSQAYAAYVILGAVECPV